MTTIVRFCCICRRFQRPDGTWTEAVLPDAVQIVREVASVSDGLCSDECAATYRREYGFSDATRLAKDTLPDMGRDVADVQPEAWGCP